MHILRNRPSKITASRIGTARSPILCALFCCLIQTTSVYAEDKADADAVVHGPTQIKLGDNLATMNLPNKYVFVKPEAAKQFLKEQGSSPEGVLGMLAPDDENSHWAVICRFDDCGYVTDDDAGKLNADEILNNYKEGTKEQNEERKEQNIPPIYVGGWTEKPRYQKDKHQVIWAIEVKDEDGASAPVKGVNYNTRILGRKGVLSMNLVTAPDKLESDKKNVLALLDQTNFVKGQNYTAWQG